MKKTTTTTTTWVLAALVGGWPAAALADTEAPALAGGVLEVEGGTLPLLDSEAELDVTGALVAARVRQRFRNDRDRALDARYVFPLPHDAAVHGLVLRVGDEVIRGKVDEVEAATRTFEKAKREGKTAALLVEHRANVFSQSVANVPAGEDVVIEIEYVQSVPRVDGRYELHLPMAVGARYANGANGVPVPALDTPLPAPARATGPETAPSAPGRGVAVRIDLEAGLPVIGLESPSHAIEVDAPSPDRRRVVLASGRVRDGRDLVLRWRVDGERTQGALLSHREDEESFFQVLVEPPALARAGAVQPRELVFVLDASCSMSGPPLESAAALMSRMLDEVRPEDRFRTIVFGSEAKQLQAEAVPPTPEHLARARRFLAELQPMGGTEIELGIRAALEPPPIDGRMRLVVFLTDGYIGSEGSVMATVRKDRGDARIFAFGVGNSVNRWLIEELGIAGRGGSEVVLVDGPDGRAAVAAAEAFATRLAAPVLVDAWIDWGDRAVTEVTPQGHFDVFAGVPVRVLGKLPKAGLGKGPAPVLVGRRPSAGGQGRELRVPLSLHQVDDAPGRSALPRLWARAQVAERMRMIAAPYPDHSGVEAQRLIDEVTALGVRYGITTRWTAFVAVSERVVAPAAEAAEPASVAAAPVSGGHSFGGASTPEPVTGAGLAVLAALGFAARRRRRDA
jgi:Ca-activated chloride channel family protein